MSGVERYSKLGRSSGRGDIVRKTEGKATAIE